jgi:hypothetical protein
MKTSSGMKATPTMVTTAPAVKTAAASAMKAAAASAMKAAPASATARLGYVCECQPYECAREDPSECQRNPLAAHSSQHVFLHLN